MTSQINRTVEINKAHIISCFSDEGGIEGFVDSIDQLLEMRNTGGRKIYPTIESAILELFNAPSFLWTYHDIEKYLEELGFDMKEVEFFNCKHFGEGSAALYKFLLCRDGLTLYEEYKSKKKVLE